ncbi:MAG: Peptide chain release factor 2 [Candidatus Magasanikbacteria bacterium GW2011_GWC2_40_17]|uniref:Peptide chain release factor 2 n=1 Tax=Candidatus Magasanikbacteria bacterium GW2011_GWA2_42_32 TaxID=1619039 RepID=A0A0G1CF94_9BACT|nr:MAG: Peptide chain release factor 2 [Candidatus Magasanikbacteria bacterium GW2011_GWC2_40_17]KKS57246.1 MAG: Peptide chain release factor 2 [Candidatus Magasanikbacteria bacterium GW2011_GWA2_42_32]OGH86136.1 MAG: peptide chain release factor 2 [Candidatus Magasanikbacteria bacterium RIFOXYB2_FULL_38_10]
MTIKEVIFELQNLLTKIKEARQILHLDKKQEEMRVLEMQMSASDFWVNALEAGKITQKYDELKKEFDFWHDLETQARDLQEMAELDAKDKTVSLREDLERQLIYLQKQFAEAEISLLFSGLHDKSNAFLSIHAGTGGVDAMDFAEMLLRMYLRFCEKRGFKTQILTESRGGEAGIKSITLVARGSYAYGFLKSEHGVHRLVRISPYDAEKMRHTSFALVEVLPEIDEKVVVEIKPEDLRIDTFMSSGKGGQSVNTTYSAVRMVHLPTGITVSCQNERSQQQNKETAMRILKAKLAAQMEEEHADELSKLRGEYHEAAWSNQIRSYVLHPYHLVKDHRTEFESKDPDKVLDGDLLGFIEAYLKMNHK